MKCRCIYRSKNLYRCEIRLHIQGDTDSTLLVHKLFCQIKILIVYLVLPSLLTSPCLWQWALLSRAANRLRALYDTGLNEWRFNAYFRIKFWKFSSSAVLLKKQTVNYDLNIIHRVVENCFCFASPVSYSLFFYC